MSGRRFVCVVALFLTLSVTASPVTVRLVPGPDGNYCQRTDAGLLVVVANGRTPFSGAVEVTFGKSKMVSQSITLKAQETKKLSFAIPDGCFTPDCGASINVTNGVSGDTAMRSGALRHVYAKAVALCVG